MIDVNKIINECVSNAINEVSSRLEAQLNHAENEVAILNRVCDDKDTRIETLEARGDSERYKRLYLNAITEIECTRISVSNSERVADYAQEITRENYELKLEVKSLVNRLAKEKRGRRKISSIKNMAYGFYKRGSK